ncbi:MAG: glycoside hydrolase family 127 protein, partial [Anaerolineaceae bacterium]|nr:glycoside hydrolase family 127 protein [Anaerolineaceae bacterium]
MAKITHLADAIRKSAPDAVQLKGLIGSRFEGSRKNRLNHQEENHLLWPFRDHCPVGWHPDIPQHPDLRGDWHGEFMGTWVDAAVLTAWNAADAPLRQKVDAMVADWLATQSPDGYLGTYDEADRWKSWDVWVQAHDIIGLLSFYHFTGKKEILDAAVRIADRVLQDFGPNKRSLRETGPHMGMASSAFLEPLIWIYWETGEVRFLEFGRWLVESDWEGEGGPQIISAILGGLGVAGTANSKGIEMLTDFAGLLELYRATGEDRYLQTILIAWEDIVSHHLYITGSASTGEYFPKDFGLHNEGIYMIGETCVSMGWLYLNLSLGRLTGDARFFDMAEQTLYNHLMAAQSPDGRLWIYYLGLRDSKRFCWHTDPECCPSRGVRAIAQMPTHTFGLLDDGIAVNFYDSAQARLPLPSGRQVRMAVDTEYPLDGNITLRMALDESEMFTLRLRLPGWCRN